MEKIITSQSNLQVCISVVIPTYKRADLLFKCLKALSLQTFNTDHFEVIVVHDGPDSDKSIKKLRSAFPFIRYYCLPENRGPAAARNYGWLNAKGTLIAFTDDDCVPDKNWLKCIWHNYNDEPEIAFTGKVKVPLPLYPTDFELNISKLETADFITANCALTKNALLKVGGFDERFRMAWREDSDLEFKLLSENVSIKKLSLALVVHPVRKAKWGVSIKEQKKGMFNALLFKKFPFLYRQKIADGPPFVYYMMILFFTGIFLFIILNHLVLSSICAFSYLLMALYLTIKRLRKTSRSMNHVLEMLITSIVIPFASVFWQWYGAIKYRAVFI